MMIILLYSSAILIETSLLVNYLRLRLVEVRLPESCSSLVKHLKIYPTKKETHHLELFNSQEDHK